MAKRTSAAITQIKPATVGERRRAKRSPTSGPGIRKVEIDLTKPEARKALAALHPEPTTTVMLDATPELESAALAYVERRDEATFAKKAQDLAGNVLCSAIGGNLGIRGDGWEATWDTKKGTIDWDAVVKEANIPAELVEKHRKPSYRQLDVREIAKDG